MKELLLEAVNEMYPQYRFCTFEDMFDIFTDDEVIDAWLEYEGILGYSRRIKEVYEVFFKLVRKTDSELFGGR